GGLDLHGRRRGAQGAPDRAPPPPGARHRAARGRPGARSPRAPHPGRRQPRCSCRTPDRCPAPRHRSLSLRRPCRRAHRGGGWGAGGSRGIGGGTARMTSTSRPRRTSSMAQGRLALLFVAILTLCPTTGLAQEGLKIGFFAPLTGFAAADGASAKHSAEIAVEELNAAGGIKGRKIELVVYDDRHDSKEAVAVANKLVEKDQVVGVVSGSYSMPSRVAAPIFAKAGLPMTVAFPEHPELTKA